MLTVHFELLEEEGKIKVWFSNESENLEFCVFKVDYLEFANVETLYAFFQVIIKELTELGLIKIDKEVEKN